MIFVRPGLPAGFECEAGSPIGESIGRYIGKIHESGQVITNFKPVITSKIA